MGIINPGALPRYEDIDLVRRQHFEQVVSNESEDGEHVQRLIDLAELEK
jgi:cobalamin-dependent methionine synthase I